MKETQLTLRSYRFYLSLFLLFFSLLVLVIGFAKITANPREEITAGVIGVGVSLYFSYKYWRNRIILMPGKLLIARAGSNEIIEFSAIVKLDCYKERVWYRGIYYRIKPILHLQLKLNNKRECYLDDTAEIKRITKWVKKHYPKCKITEDVLGLL